MAVVYGVLLHKLSAFAEIGSGSPQTRPVNNPNSGDSVTAIHAEHSQFLLVVVLPPHPQPYKSYNSWIAGILKYAQPWPEPTWWRLPRPSDKITVKRVCCHSRAQSMLPSLPGQLGRVSGRGPHFTDIKVIFQEQVNDLPLALPSTHKYKICVTNVQGPLRASD